LAQAIAKLAPSAKKIARVESPLPAIGSVHCVGADDVEGSPPDAQRGRPTRAPNTPSSRHLGFFNTMDATFPA
jgi:hypothetical protein